MTRTSLPKTPKKQASIALNQRLSPAAQKLRRNRRSPRKSDVLVSAVISPYLLTHLHHVLQRAEYGAAQEGKTSQASNFAQLRKVLCMDARSMEDASAAGMRDTEIDNSIDAKIGSKVA